MKKSIVKTLIAILLCLLVVGGVARALTGQAQAAPAVGHHKSVNDHCIDYSEWMTPPQYLDRGRLESSMGVRDDGRQVSSQNDGKNIVLQYAACNHPESEMFYQISYSRNVAGIYKATYFSQWKMGKNARLRLP